MTEQELDDLAVDFLELIYERCRTSVKPVDAVLALSRTIGGMVAMDPSGKGERRHLLLHRVADNIQKGVNDYDAFLEAEKREAAN